MTINLHGGNAGIRDETGRTGPGRAVTGRSEAGRSEAGRRGGGRGRWLTGLGAVGVGYSLSWIAGLSVSAPSPAFGASGRQIVAAFAGHGAALATQFALTEGLPAAGIAVVTVALASAARARGQITAGQITAGRFALASGLTAAIISVLQFGLGLLLATTSSPGTAQLAYAAVNRMDGGKMLALAVLGAAGAAMTPLPKWLRITGIALAVSIAVSGVVYLLLLSSLAAAAGPALVLLLIFITGCGIIIGMQNGAASRGDS